MIKIRTYLYVVTPETDVDILLKELLPALPQWRYRQAVSFRNHLDIFLCAMAFQLLKDGLARDFGISGELDFSYGPNGKPYLAAHPGIHFNLSHCGKGVACAVADVPVGIDIESIQFDEELAGAVLNEDEWRDVMSSDDKALRFTEAWTRKESFLKMTGCGIIDDMKHLAFGDTSFDTEIDTRNGYVLTLAYVKEES